MVFQNVRDEYISFKKYKLLLSQHLKINVHLIKGDVESEHLFSFYFSYSLLIRNHFLIKSSSKTIEVVDQRDWFKGIIANNNYFKLICFWEIVKSIEMISVR